MERESRRSFNKKLLASLTAYGLIETLFEQELLAAPVKPIVARWLNELADLCREVKTQKIKDVEFQKQLEALYQRVDLAELVQFIDVDGLARRVKLPERGAHSAGLDLSKVEGLAGKIVFGKQIFCLSKGRSIVPHGHNNMCTGFLVLRGTFHGRHYERLADEKDHILIRPTIDDHFKPGGCSTISDTKDNVHWFKAESDTGFIFNIHVLNYNPTNKKPTGRVYLDPEGEKTSEGLIRALRLTSRACHRKYG
jgi:hypothetical protein